MVQVDIFWSFAFGAGFAACAAKQLENEDKPFESKPYIKALTWLALFFVPSGAFLLWAFPRWETMQVGTYDTIPAWLVALFALTNVTQGMLGFWLTSKFLREKKYYAANLVSPIAWFVFWFVLVHGWDGTGFRRFFYCATDWSGAVTPWVHGSFEWYWPVTWLFSPVAISLLIMGIIMIPFLVKWMLDLQVEGEYMAREEGPSSVRPMPLLLYFRAGVVDALGAAIAASILIHLMGWILGLVVFLPLAYFVLLRDGGLTQQAIGPRFIPFERPEPEPVDASLAEPKQAVEEETAGPEPDAVEAEIVDAGEAAPGEEDEEAPPEEETGKQE